MEGGGRGPVHRLRRAQDPPPTEEPVRRVWGQPPHHGRPRRPQGAPLPRREKRRLKHSPSLPGVQSREGNADLGRVHVMPVTLTCEQCGRSYSVPPSRAKTSRFCGRECSAIAQKKPLVRMECEHCGSARHLKASEARRTRYCSLECYHAAERPRRRARARTEREAPPAEKRCTQCTHVKPISEFYNFRYGRYGKRADCKECANERSRAWYRSNFQRVARTKRAYARRNKNRMQRYRAQWASENPDSIRTYTQRRRARLAGAAGRHTEADVVRLWQRQRGECARCGVRLGSRSEERAFHVDHITPISRGGSNWPRNLQLLCPLCNTRKKDKTPAEFTLYLLRMDA